MPYYRRKRTYRKKRRGGGTLTGGTGDVNPQWFNLLDCVQSATGTQAVSQASVVPVQQSVYMRAGKTLVMELLSLQISHTGGASNKDGMAQFFQVVLMQPLSPCLIFGRLIPKMLLLGCLLATRAYMALLVL